MIVLDFEFNQAFEFGKNGCKTNPDCRFEIIQIGAVKVNENYDITDSFDALIKPSIYRCIHPYVEKITGFTDKDFKKESVFKEVYPKFREFIGDDVLLGTWGNSDIRALYRNIVFHKLAQPPIMIQYVDIQNLATKALNYSKGSSIGLKNAVEAFEIEIDRPFHNALDDAYYTARVLKTLDIEKPPIRIFNSSHLKSKAKRKAVTTLKTARSKSNRIKH